MDPSDSTSVIFHGSFLILAPGPYYMLCDSPTCSFMTSFRILASGLLSRAFPPDYGCGRLPLAHSYHLIMARELPHVLFDCSLLIMARGRLRRALLPLTLS